MAYAPPYRPAYEQDATSRNDSRTVTQWMLGFAAILAFFGALCALVLFQITAEGPAKSSLRRATAALTEIDALLARQYEDIQAQANASAADEPIKIADFPIDLGLTAGDVQGVSKEDVRALVLDRSADVLYEDGTGALRASAEDGGSLGLFSVAGFTDRALGALTSQNHTRAGVATIVLAIVTAALGFGAITAAKGWGRLGTASAIAGVGGLLLLAMGALVRMYADSQSDGEYLRSELFGITADHATVAFIIGAAFAGAATIVGMVAFVMGRLTRHTDGVR